jgi:putative endonuclease
MAFVYFLICNRNNKFFSYIGWTNNLDKRVSLHNQSKGAKFTKGSKWKLIYYEVYNNKIDAMKREHALKKNRKLRNFIKKRYINNDKNI